jgi:hypothetical protein
MFCSVGRDFRRIVVRLSRYIFRLSAVLGGAFSVCFLLVDVGN